MDSDNQYQGTTKKAILQEIRSRIRKNGKDWWRSYFNNFAGNLPYGYRKGGREEAAAASAIRNKKVILIIGNPNDNASERRRAMTCEEFQQDIDATLLETGLDFGKIERLQNEYRDTLDISALRKLYGYAFPAFVRLMEKGYRRYPDLTS